MDTDEFLDMLRRLVDTAGGQRAFARQHGITPSLLSDVLGRRRPPNPALVEAVGYRREIVFEPVKDAAVETVTDLERRLGEG